MKIEGLPGPFGVEVSDVDLANCSDDDLETILRSIYDERFAVIRTGGLRDEDFVRFGHRCGTPVRFDETADIPELFHVTNLDVDTARYARGAAHWHTDLSFTPLKASFTMLYSVAAPREGGETRFCNLAAAYEALPESTRVEIEDLTVEHRHGVSVSARPGDHTPIPPEGWDEGTTVFHPLVRQHPVTGRQTLYAITGTSQGVQGMDPASGAALLNRLCDHAFRAPFLTTHRHRVHDLVIWDNPTTMHSATPIGSATGPADTRILRRMSLHGKPSVFS
ncbi:MAG: TauD/TfdA family dioxygenase [Gammaproteobacteria bacterium]|nr:TauD/TfdA family dioxygenase [Gammaproteobacteria bacterium]